MAGHGPAPADVRRRHNKPARGDWVDLPPLERPVLCELPLDGEWSPRTVAMWKAWRSDPVTSQWSPADVAYALDTILLYEEKRVAKANEIRLRMDSLGLTPKGKRDLRWRVAEPEAASPQRRVSRGASDRRARLTRVK